MVSHNQREREKEYICVNIMLRGNVFKAWLLLVVFYMYGMGDVFVLFVKYVFIMYCFFLLIIYL